MHLTIPPKYAPYVRYLLIGLLGYLVAKDWMPRETALVLLADPTTIEVTTEALLGLSTLIWYERSDSRRALRDSLAHRDTTG